MFTKKARPGTIKKVIIKLLKTSKRPFFNEEGQEITAEEFADQLCSMDIKDAADLQKKIQENETKSKPN